MRHTPEFHSRSRCLSVIMIKLPMKPLVHKCGFTLPYEAIKVFFEEKYPFDVWAGGQVVHGSESMSFELEGLTVQLAQLTKWGQSEPIWWT